MAKKEKVNLLLVDDHPPNLIAVSAVLENHDYNLITATSGQEALRQLLHDEFAVVLLDVAMPGMDGFEVATAMKTSERTRYIPIIFVSAIAKDLQDVYRGYSVGGVDYIVKPLEPEVVRAKVSVFAELFRRRREIQRKDELIRNSERAESLQREQAARRRAEDAEQRFRNLVNALNHAIILEGDPHLSKLTFVSERVGPLLGYPHDRWMKEPDFFLHHVHVDDQSLVLQTLESLRSYSGDRMGERCEHQMLSANGDLRWFHTGFDLERDKQGIPVRVRAVSVDISPLKKVERELREAVRAREEIVEVVAHDIKTPLTAADLTASLLKRSVERRDLNLATKQVERVKVSIQRAISLAENILDIKKADTHRLAAEIREENVNDMMSEVVEILQPLATEKGIQVELELGVNCCLVECDKERIRQVLANIIGNAIKFTPNHGRVWVGVEAKDGNALFSVRDNGPGISPDELPHIFDRYWRASSTQRSGLGLGLAIAKEIVEAHGGRIWAESTPGAGTVFYFTLPLAQASSQVG